mgnify:CR=1 FL=1
MPKSQLIVHCNLDLELHDQASPLALSAKDSNLSSTKQDPNQKLIKTKWIRINKMRQL